MSTVESVKIQIEALGTSGQEEILHYLKEVLIIGSFANYMYWFKWLQYFNNEKDALKARIY